MAEEPEWLTQAVGSLNALLGGFEDVAQVTRRMLGEATGLPRLTKLLTVGDESQKAEERRNAAERDAEIAGAEIERGFATLAMQGVVLYWAALETYVDDVVIGVVRSDLEVLRGDDLARVKIPLGDLLAMPDDDRFEFLLREVESSLRSRMKAGTSRFEPLLSAVGLGGPVRDATQRNLFRLHKVRNLVAHRGGRIDRRFLDECPGFGEGEIGERLNLDATAYHELVRAAVDYAFTIHARAVRRFGGAPVRGWENLEDDPWAVDLGTDDEVRGEVDRPDEGPEAR